MRTTLISGAICSVCGKKETEYFYENPCFVSSLQDRRIPDHRLPRGWSWVISGWDSSPGYAERPNHKLGPDAVVCSEVCEARYKIVAAVVGLGSVLKTAGLDHTWEVGPDGECRVAFTIPPKFIWSER